MLQEQRDGRGIQAHSASAKGADSAMGAGFAQIPQEQTGSPSAKGPDSAMDAACAQNPQEQRDSPSANSYASQGTRAPVTPCTQTATQDDSSPASATQSPLAKNTLLGYALDLLEIGIQALGTNRLHPPRVRRSPRSSLQVTD